MSILIYYAAMVSVKIVWFETSLNDSDPARYQINEQWMNFYNEKILINLKHELLTVYDNVTHKQLYILSNNHGVF